MSKQRVSSTGPRRLSGILTLSFLINLIAACTGGETPTPQQIATVVATTPAPVTATVAAEPAAAGTDIFRSPLLTPETTETITPTLTVPTATPTPTPTETTTPTPDKPAEATPKPATQEAESPKAVISVASANIRSGPGTNYDIVAKATQGQSYEVVGRTADKQWYQIEMTDGSLKWVGAAVVTSNLALETTPIITQDKFPPTPAAPTSPETVPQPIKDVAYIKGDRVNTYSQDGTTVLGYILKTNIKYLKILSSENGLYFVQIIKLDGNPGAQRYVKQTDVQTETSSSTPSNPNPEVPVAPSREYIIPAQPNSGFPTELNLKDPSISRIYNGQYGNVFTIDSRIDAPGTNGYHTPFAFEWHMFVVSEVSGNIIVVKSLATGKQQSFSLEPMMLNVMRPSSFSANMAVQVSQYDKPVLVADVIGKGDNIGVATEDLSKTRVINVLIVRNG